MENTFGKRCFHGERRFFLWMTNGTLIINLEISTAFPDGPSLWHGNTIYEDSPAMFDDYGHMKVEFS